jgi:diguanylate cyclase (GGDEF)-like protein
MRLGLGAKFTLTVLVILAGTMAANTLYFLRTSARLHEEQLAQRGRALGRLVSLISPEAILGFDFLLLNDYTREVATQPDVLYAVIVSAEDVPISYHFDSGIVRQWQAAGSRDVLQLVRKLAEAADPVRLEFPITHGDRTLGRFLVGISRQSLQREFQRQLVIQALIVTLIVSFLSAAIYGVFRFNVLLPIKKLIAASREVGRGKYPLVEANSADELGLLARAFNTMAKEVQHEQAKLHRQAHFDLLTGLPNRMMALERINLEISRARRSGERFAVLFIDLDDFKNVNDSLGHAVGDELLAAVGARLQANLRNIDTVARLGGDEFLILLPNIVGEVQVERITERLLDAMVAAEDLRGHKVSTQCSIGVALYPDNGETVEALMANADNAMYQAKAARSGSAVFFTEEMNIRLRERLKMEQDLSRAIELGELSLHFQPIVELPGERHCGAEVLLRWRNSERGYVSPVQFIPLAEATGQILAIGDWVLEQACRTWAAWRASGVDPGFLSVNISRVQFRKPFARRVGELMSAFAIPREALKLEITESVLLEDHEQVAAELGSLRALGVTLSLDDFGTGYSSLSYLKRFRFDVLKIDPSFVAGLPADADDVSLVKAILAMAKGLSLQVVAEGVETSQQVEFLAAQGCHCAQGYFFARPMDSEAYGRFLQSRDLAKLAEPAEAG